MMRSYNILEFAQSVHLLLDHFQIEEHVLLQPVKVILGELMMDPAFLVQLGLLLLKIREFVFQNMCLLRLTHVMKELNRFSF